jgi:hypothetical protein
VLRRLAVLVLFSLAGLVAGVEASWYGGHYYPDWFGWLGGYRYYFDAGVVLPPGSDARHLVAMMGGRHPGVQVVARATRIITSSAAGSIHAGWAVTKAGSEVVALNDGKGKTFVEHGIGCDLAGNPVDYGLLAGLRTGLGVPCPPGGVCQPDSRAQDGASPASCPRPACTRRRR